MHRVVIENFWNKFNIFAHSLVLKEAVKGAV